MKFIDHVREGAAATERNIVFPEGTEPRILKAAEFLSRNRILKCTLLGDRTNIERACNEGGVDSRHLDIIDPEKSLWFEEFSHFYLKLRQGRETEASSREIMRNPLYFGAMMTRTGKVNGVVAGSVFTTGEVLRAAIQVIGPATGYSLVSSTFEMILAEGCVVTFADCAVVPQPDSEQLAEIALAASETHRRLTGEEPVVAMLSFSTKGSADHKMVEHIQKATEIAKARAPELRIDGELQFDSAFVKSVAEHKAPGSQVAGKANVFIFPDLNAGNIAYKITERLAGAQAVGPILQGLNKPMNDLSRGCSWNDIVDVACICSLLN